MGHPKQIAHEATNIGWRRIVVTTVIGTLVTVTLDHFGLVSKLAGLLPGAGNPGSGPRAPVHGAARIRGRLPLGRDPTGR